ncbi:MAG: hypothetical protein PHO37_15905 [Kiritimatiellae bacterium]|nr:hypothetical protein [Kiritimatiellia bacterium]
MVADILKATQYIRRYAVDAGISAAMRWMLVYPPLCGGCWYIRRYAVDAGISADGMLVL